MSIQVMVEEVHSGNVLDVRVISQPSTVEEKDFIKKEGYLTIGDTLIGKIIEANSVELGRFLLTFDKILPKIVKGMVIILRGD